MTTKLELINKVLLSVGQRQVPSSTSSSVSILAANTLDEVLVDLQQEGVWAFVRKRITGDDVSVAWTGDVLTIPDLLDVTRIMYQGRELVYIPDEYEPYNVTYTTIGRRYRINTDRTIRVYGALSLEEQAGLTIDYIRQITLPVLDTAVVDVPRDFENLALKKTRAMMYLTHLDDVNSYQLALRDYEQHRATVLVRNAKSPGRSSTFYKTRYQRRQY